MKIHQISIDLNKIDKTRIKEHPNGARYYELTVIENDQPNQWGQTLSVCTAQTKEERESKAQRRYLGNGKTVWSSEGGSNTPTDTPSQQSNEPVNDLPF